MERGYIQSLSRVDGTLKKYTVYIFSEQASWRKGIIWLFLRNRIVT